MSSIHLFRESGYTPILADVILSIMMFNPTFNNISVLSYPSVLVVEDPEVTDQFYPMMLYRVRLAVSRI